MEELNQDIPDVQETPEGDPTPSDGGEDTPKTEELSAEEIADLKKKARASSKNFERAKKAQKELEELQQARQEAPTQSGGLNTKDVLALTENHVSSEDYDEVVRVSTILGKTVSEALKDKTLKSILAERVEERTTAQATQTTGGARGTTKNDGASALQKAEETGEVPDTEAGMKALAEARIARARNNR